MEYHLQSHGLIQILTQKVQADACTFALMFINELVLPTESRCSEDSGVSTGE